MKISFDTEDERLRFCNFLKKLQIISEFGEITNQDGPTKDKPHFESFNLMWSNVSKKSDKALSEKRWGALNSKHKEILYNYVRRMSKGEWLSKDKQYISTIAVIINKKTYLDDIEVSAPIKTVTYQQEAERMYPHYPPQEKVVQATDSQVKGHLKNLFNPKSVPQES